MIGFGEFLGYGLALFSGRPADAAGLPAPSLTNDKLFIQYIVGSGHASKTKRVPVYERKSFVGITARAIS
jgi:hypothetical protein